VNLLKLICHTIVHLPENLANFFKERQRQNVLDALEVERLDRIRNPEKYRGK
jgi:hypothetical protein